MITEYHLPVTDVMIQLTVANSVDRICFVWTQITFFSIHVGDIFQVLFYQPTFNLLIVFYRLLAGNLGLAIVAVALLSRIVTYPMTRAQIKSAARGKEFQSKYNKLKKKYAKNKEKLNQELAKLQAEYLPGQIGGCLPLIIMIILLIQVRSGIRNLVDQGWHAYNEVAYVESLKGDEDFISYNVTDDLEYGAHTFKVAVTSDGGHKVEREYTFEVVENVENRLEEIKAEEEAKSDEDRAAEEQALQEAEKAERDSDFSLYNPTLEDNKQSITLSKFLIITTKSKTTYLFTDRQPDFEVFVRPPSNENVEDVLLQIDGEEVSAIVEDGEPINLSFLGMDLSKAAADFSWSDSTIIPYVVLAVFLGITQYGSTRVMMGLRATGDDGKKKKDDKKKKKKKDEEPDMAEMMTAMNKQMAFMFPLLTIVTSLGYWGGSNLFPAGLSVFWTVQSLFVIIQQFLMNRGKAVQMLKERLGRAESKN